ncbi:hypothetical protein N665_2211s0007 [Sinapis alba]|nr:hypothetical protein N665_2211s0007 [Sinapis alba]
MDPFSHPCSFQNLLNSQQPNTSFASVERSASDGSVFGSQWHEDGDEDGHIVSDRKERRKWSPVEDVVLISAWLNTSKDPVTGNEQKAIAFWKRIAAYFGSSPKLAGLPKREASHCKQRWGKINEGVCKFVGCYNAATKQKSSGQSENDVLIMAHEIFFNDYKLDDQSSTSVPADDEAMARPVGVKAAKGKGRSKATTQEDEVKPLVEFQTMWEIRQQDFALKEKLNKQQLLDSLIAKT